MYSKSILQMCLWKQGKYLSAMEIWGMLFRIVFDPTLKGWIYTLKVTMWEMSAKKSISIFKFQSVKFKVHEDYVSYLCGILLDTFQYWNRISGNTHHKTVFQMAIKKYEQPDLEPEIQTTI